MTHDDDCVRLHLFLGTRLIPCKALGLEWPPPERLTSLNGTDFSDDPLVRVAPQRETTRTTPPEWRSETTVTRPDPSVPEAVRRTKGERS